MGFSCINAWVGGVTGWSHIAFALLLHERVQKLDQATQASFCSCWLHKRCLSGKAHPRLGIAVASTRSLTRASRA